MEKDNRYTAMDDAQIKEKTGKTSSQWYEILDAFGARTKKGAESVGHLVKEYKLGKFWARTL